MAARNRRPFVGMLLPRTMSYFRRRLGTDFGACRPMMD